MKTLWLLLAVADMLLADGGALQWKSRAGPFELTVFTAPVPLRAGPAEISVLVERADNHGVVLDADVVLHLSDRRDYLKATHELATNKMLYAANTELTTPGECGMELSVTSSVGSGSAHGWIQVLPAEAPLRRNWPYFAVVPACIVLFFLNQTLRTRGRKM